MVLKALIQQLKDEGYTLFVTILLKPHRRHLYNKKDKILLRNLIEEAEERIVQVFGEKAVIALLKKTVTVQNEVDMHHNLDSLYVFVSNNTKGIVTLSQATFHYNVQIPHTFTLRSPGLVL